MSPGREARLEMVARRALPEGRRRPRLSTVTATRMLCLRVGLAEARTIQRMKVVRVVGLTPRRQMATVMTTANLLLMTQPRSVALLRAEMGRKVLLLLTALPPLRSFQVLTAQVPVPRPPPRTGVPVFGAILRATAIRRVIW